MCGLRVGVDQQWVRYAIPMPDALLVELLFQLLDLVHAEHDLEAAPPPKKKRGGERREDTKKERSVSVNFWSCLNLKLRRSW